MKNKDFKIRIVELAKENKILPARLGFILIDLAEDIKEELDVLSRTCEEKKQ